MTQASNTGRHGQEKADLVDNSLSPHGGVLVERVAPPGTSGDRAGLGSLPRLPVRDQIAGECAEKYGFGSPFVGEKYLANRTPVMSMPRLEVTPELNPELTGEGSGCTCSDK